MNDACRRSMRRLLLPLGAALALAGCGGGGASPAAPAGPPRAVAFASGLEHPWGLDFLPDGALLVTERPGRLRRIAVDGTVGAPIAGVPTVFAEGQGGLLDVALDPAFAANRRVYLSFAEADGGLARTAVARAVLSADATRLEQLAVIFRQRPARAGAAHFGGRLAFARDGTLFVTLGDRLEARDEAQNLANHLGKVVRITTDGAAPADNPFVATPGAAAEIWTLGHRNVQGAAIDAAGRLWTAEHGPQGGDELNLTLAGVDHGWPRVSYGCEYGSPVGDACRIGGGTHAPDFAEPATTWTPTSTAPAGIAFVGSARYPQWRGDLLVAALAGRVLWRLRLDGDRVASREPLFGELGERLRDVAEAPDGRLYLLTDSAQGRVLRVER